MTITVNVHQAKTHLSRLGARVGLGEEIIITKAGKPVARLMPIAERSFPRTPGTAGGRLVIMHDFDAPLPDSVMASLEECR
jgi:prevent-host-death family protein